jgi:membrane-bound lytic murein transglycosylase B
MARIEQKNGMPAFAGMTHKNIRHTRAGGCLILFFLIWMSVSSVQAAPFQNDSGNAFSIWLSALQQDAIANGISPETARSALGVVMLDDRVVTLDQKQPEGTVTFDAYSRRIVSASRITTGHALLEKYSTELNEIGQRYGVQPQVIVALWGMESSFGRNSGDYNIVDSLVTLAYEGRRADFFRKELFNALRILDQEHIPATSLRGSWAGAMGQCQFMPSTYLRYAVDYNNNGVKNIWTEPTDVWASIANYIAAEGWKSDQTWGREVELQKDITASEIGLDHQHTLAEWQQWGVRSLDGSALPDKPLKASLIQPDGADGRSFLVYDNFRALMRWNHSTYFATAVGLLADRIDE